MKKIAFSLAFILSISFITTSCGGDGADCNDEAAVATAFEGLSDELVETLFQFGQDPSTSNCNRVRDVYLEWIERLEAVEDCANDLGQGAEFDAAVEEARNELDNFIC